MLDWCNKNEVIRHYYTLSDLILTAKNVTTIPLSYKIGKVEADEFKTIITAILGDPTGTTATETIVNNLWCKYLAPYHLKSVIMWRDNEEITTASGFEEWAIKLVAQVQRTFTKYSTIISNYLAEASSLMDDVQIKNVTKFNDTPQVPQTSGSSYEDDDFMSTLTVNTASSNDGTKMQRLEEIRRLWLDAYVQWADEFKELFLDEEII